MVTRNGELAIPRGRGHEGAARGPLEVMVVDLARDLHAIENPEERWIELGASAIETFCCRAVEARGLSWKLIRRAINAQARSGSSRRAGRLDTGFDKAFGDDGFQHLVRRHGRSFPPATLCGMSIQSSTALVAAAPCADCLQIAIAENVETP